MQPRCLTNFRLIINGGGVKTKFGVSILRNCKIINKGENNRIILGDYTRLNGCTFYFYGSNNTIRIGSFASCKSAVFWLENDNNEIEIGEHTGLHGEIHLATIEGTKIKIGYDCMFSSKIDIRTGDSHSIIRRGTKHRINPSKSVEINDHVWVGTGVRILKGTAIPDHCMVGAGSLLNKRYVTPHSIIAGIPAREVKHDIDWLRECI